MAQYNAGTVRVTNGSTTVRHEWRLLMTGVAGGFNPAPGASVTWPGGTGTTGTWDSVTGTLMVARITGANPAAGMTVTATPGTATVSSVAPGSPPNWDARVTLPAVATFERHYKDYDVATLAPDSFVLGTAYLGATDYGSEYGLNTDFTSLGLGLIQPGDVGATAIVSRSMVRLNNLLTRGAAVLELSSAVVLSDGFNATLSWGIQIEDTGGFVVGALPVTFFVVPSGIRRVDVSASVRLASALSAAAQRVTLKLSRGSDVLTWDSVNQAGQGRAVSLAGLRVNAGDQISLAVESAGTGLPTISVHKASHLRIAVREVI